MPHRRSPSPTRTLSLRCCQIKAWKAGHKGECVVAARADCCASAPFIPRLICGAPPAAPSCLPLSNSHARRLQYLNRGVQLVPHLPPFFPRPPEKGHQRRLQGMAREPTRPSLGRHAAARVPRRGRFRSHPRHRQPTATTQVRALFNQEKPRRMTGCSLCSPAQQRSHLLGTGTVFQSLAVVEGLLVTLWRGSTASPSTLGSRERASARAREKRRERERQGSLLTIKK